MTKDRSAELPTKLYHRGRPLESTVTQLARSDLERHWKSPSAECGIEPVASFRTTALAVEERRVAVRQGI